jgi:hypothetical protein
LDNILKIFENNRFYFVLQGRGFSFALGNGILFNMGLRRKEQILKIGTKWEPVSDAASYRDTAVWHCGELHRRSTLLKQLVRQKLACSDLLTSSSAVLNFSEISTLLRAHSWGTEAIY